MGAEPGLEEEAEAVIEIVIYEKPQARPLHPCELGHHRWAWLVDGRQACGYCGVLR